MRYLFIIFIFMFGININSYADASDILDKPDYDVDEDSGENMIKSLEEGIGLATGVLNNSSLRDTNAYDISNSRDIITGGKNIQNDNIKVINGDKSTKLKTLTGKESEYSAPECRVGQEQIAKLVIPNGKPTSINLYLYQPTNISYHISSVYGVCDNKFTVCSIEANKQICKDFLKRDGVEQGMEITSGSNTMENNIAESNICNNITECMSWRFVKYVDTKTAKGKLSVEPAGKNCSQFPDKSITISQKDMIIQNLTGILSELANENNLGALSDTKLDNNDNTNTGYFVLKNTCNNIDNESKDIYAGSMTDLNDLTSYYNNNKDIQAKTDEERKKQYNELLGQSPIGKKLDNSSKSIDKFMKDNQTMQNSLNKVSSGVKVGNEMTGELATQVSIPTVCYSPNCTVDIVKEDDSSPSTANQGKSKNPVPSSRRVFRTCEAVGYDEQGGIKKTQYKCPITTNIKGLKEIPVAQDRSQLASGEQKTKILALDNSISQIGDDLYCTCYNAHEYKANLQKTLVATKLAEQMNLASCGDTSYDNDTRNTIVDKRNDCSKHTIGSEEYNKCMGISKK